LGLIRLRAFGVFNLQVVQPVLFINRLVGTQGIYTTADVEEYLNRVIISRFNDHMGETIDSILNLPAKYDELSNGLSERLHEDFEHFGINLTHIYISSITPPPEVQQAIDDRSRMGVFDDMNKLMQMKAAMAMEKASEAEGGSGMGMGAGMGLMMPAMFAQYFAGGLPQSGKKGDQQKFDCPECHQPIPVDAKFCHQCGHQQLVFNQCTGCNKNLTPGAKFCPRCGKSVADEPQTKSCPTCGNDNLADSMYCNECGEKL
jgi:membrane protease subunit (stomatin/prohibitin family)